VPSGLTAHPVKPTASKSGRAATNIDKGRNPLQIAIAFRGVFFNRCTIRIGLLNHDPFVSDVKYESNNSNNDQDGNEYAQGVPTRYKSIKLGGKPVEFIVG
jgi:hypothetical protein